MTVKRRTSRGVKPSRVASPAAQEHGPGQALLPGRTRLVVAQDGHPVLAGKRPFEAAARHRKREQERLAAGARRPDHLIPVLQKADVDGVMTANPRAASRSM